MPILLSLVLTLSLSCLSALASDNGTNNQLSEAERARVKAQLESLQKSKIQAAESANKVTKDSALRDAHAIDQKLKQQKQSVDKDVEGYSWLYGSDAARLAGQGKKQQLEAQAKAEHDKVKAAALKKAAASAAAAKKSTENLQQSVEGLKSQVGTKGQYGLKPKGSSLYVRQYGK